MALASTTHLPGGQLPSNHPPMLSGWKQEQRAELGAIWVVIVHDLDHSSCVLTGEPF